ncbi:MAG: HEAT repeat domain-containing protein [Planctomycetia bacterium]
MRRVPALLALFAVLVVGAAPALAKLEPAEWKVVEQEFARLYTPAPGKVGFEADKGSLLNLLIQDAEARSFKLLGDALLAECTLWLNAQKAVAETSEAIGLVLTKPSKARTPEEEAKMFQLQKELPRMEEDARIERVILGNIVKAVGGGPAPVKAALYARAKSSQDWTLRAAVAQVAGVEPTEKDAASFLVRSLAPSSEKDPRVRAAALEGLAANPEGAEDHVVGRLADPDWQVQLLAVRHVRTHKLSSAIPHLITGLDLASPRMRDELGSALKELTGQNFDPYGEVWAKWWEDNRAKFQGSGPAKVGSRPSNPVIDPELYGVPVKSDRVLFVIDISGSMKESIKKPPAGPERVVTPAEGAPPPEELDLGGPKVNVAVDQVRKAI